MAIVFFIFLLLSVYSYAFFPLLLWILKGVLARPWKQGPAIYSVSIIISVHNEEKVIQAKIENALALDYPGDLLEIIVSSDGSTDNTHEIASRFKDSGVIVKTFDRLGKTECLNRTIGHAKGEIILFTDANSIFPPDLLKNIAGNFVDPDIGLVTGWTKYLKADGGQDVTGIYAKLEKTIKYCESLIDSCVGADGAVFAIRKSLYKPLDVNDINDFIIPLHVIRQKKRVVLDPRVFCYELAAENGQKAYSRQVRITTRTLRAIRCNLHFLNLRNYGFFSFFFLSHKILRLSVPFFLLFAFFLGFILLGQALLYDVIFVGFLLFFGIGFLGLSGVMNGRLASVCKYFLITFTAQFIGWVRMIAGIKDTTWSTER